MKNKGIFLLGCLLIFIFTGCGKKEVTQPEQVITPATPLPPSQASLLPQTIMSKNKDEALFVFNAVLNLVRKNITERKMLSSNDKAVILNADPDSYTVDKLKGGGVDGTIQLPSDILKVAEDGIIAGLLGHSIIIEKFNLKEWETATGEVFYPSQLTLENLEIFRKQFNITKVLAYRWLAYGPAEENNPTRIRLFFRIIDTSTGIILYANIIEGDYLPASRK